MFAQNLVVVRRVLTNLHLSTYFLTASRFSPLTLQCSQLSARLHMKVDLRLPSHQKHTKPTAFTYFPISERQLPTIA